MNGEEMEDVLLGIAIGMERLLKGILYDLNPMYVYKTPTFKNLAQILHEDKIVAGAKSELSDKADADVVSFRTALSMASAISATTFKHKAFLFRLSEQRDIVAHCQLSLFDRGSARNILLRDLYFVLKEYSKEIGIPLQTILGSSEIPLAKIAADNQTDLPQKINAKLDAHRKQWAQLQKQAGYIAKAERLTKQRVEAKVTGDWGDWGQTIDCPACGQTAVVRIEPDVDIQDGEAVVMGVFVTNLICAYCKLEIADYNEIDYLGLNQSARASFSDDSSLT
jgi:hypothetical protein